MLWQYQGVEEAISEHEDTMRTNYPFLFEDTGLYFSHLIKKMKFSCNCMYMRV